MDLKSNQVSFLSWDDLIYKISELMADASLCLFFTTVFRP